MVRWCEADVLSPTDPVLAASVVKGVFAEVARPCVAKSRELTDSDMSHHISETCFW